MKYILQFSALALLCTPIYAQHYDGDPDMEQSVLNDHSKGVTSTWIHPGLNDEYGSVRLDINRDNHDDLPPPGAGTPAVDTDFEDDC